MNRINKLFQEKGKNILSVYFTAGYPKLDDTVETIKQLSSKGVDLIEIGVPFSDPLADGPVIQHSSQVALKNGMSVKLLFEQLKDIRKVTDIPLVLMGYVNPIIHFGFENFCKKAQEVGIDGFIIPDLPMLEYQKEFKPISDKYGIENVFLITPETSDERIREVDDNTNAFIYMVSSASTTGVQSSFAGAKEDYFNRIKSMNLKNPAMIGFGISNKQTFESACKYSSGAIIGSAFIKSLNETSSVADAVDLLLKKLGE
ncbi:MAG: tryptophan synthase subunit alpha [Paludibacteraceae bacterium]|nr:tryptophan synthase subunit alpha [Paludibacteraceae bacterium]MBP5741963.1 tryptophan synthase subunit alpha [Paludibacteraceae bacterium]